MTGSWAYNVSVLVWSVQDCGVDRNLGFFLTLRRKPFSERRNRPASAAVGLVFGVWYNA